MEGWQIGLIGTAVTVAFIVLVPYMLGPIFIFFALRFKNPSTVLVVNPREEPLPEDARKYFSDAYQALTGLGFELVGTLGLPDLTPGAMTLFVLYANRTTADMAISAIIVAKNALSPTLKTSYVEFEREYDDGVTVQTNNSRELSAFKRLPNEFTTKFWNIKDLRKLFNIHLLLCERFRQRGRPVLRLDSEYGGDPLRYVAECELAQTFRKQVSTGYLAETSEGFRPSVVGAFIMTWQELWPAKAIRRAAERKRAQSLLAELKQQAPAAP